MSRCTNRLVIPICYTTPRTENRITRSRAAMSAFGMYALGGKAGMPDAARTRLAEPFEPENPWGAAGAMCASTFVRLRPNNHEATGRIVKSPACGCAHFRAAGFGSGASPMLPPNEADRSSFSCHSLLFENSRFWSGRRDSNPRPQPWQGCALPLSYTRIRVGYGGLPHSGYRLQAMPNDARLCNHANPAP